MLIIKTKNNINIYSQKEGIKEKITLTEKFIERKKKEYDQLQADMQMYKTNGKYVQAKGSI